MGRGQSTSASRPAAAVGRADADTPGRSARARETYALLAGAGIDRQWLLADLEAGKATDPRKVDAFALAHNAMMAWFPEAYPGHGGYKPALDRWRDDIAFVLMLDGDHKAKHTFFYQDSVEPGYWTVGMGQAARAYYGLPSDEDGGLVSAGLPEAIAASMRRADGCFSTLIRERPSAVMAVSAIRSGRPITDADRPRPGAAAALASHLDALPAERRIAFEAAQDLCEAAGLDPLTSGRVCMAAAWAPSYGRPVSEGREWGGSTLDESEVAEIRRIRDQLTVSSDAEHGLPILGATTPHARLVADACRAWMASPHCDHVSEEQRQVANAPDDATWVDRTRVLCARTGYLSEQGRARLQPDARRQEARLRGVLGFLAGATIKAEASLSRQLKA